MFCSSELNKKGQTKETYLKRSSTPLFYVYVITYIFLFCFTIMQLVAVSLLIWNKP